MEESNVHSAQRTLLTQYIRDLLERDGVSVKFPAKNSSVVIFLKESYAKRSGVEKIDENISGDLDKALAISGLFSDGKEICFDFRQLSDKNDTVSISEKPNNATIDGTPSAHDLKCFDGNGESKFKELSLYIVKTLSELGVDKYRAMYKLITGETRFNSLNSILQLKSGNMVISYRPSQDKLVVKGQVITMSKIKEIIDEIEPPKPKMINVFSLEKVVIDTSLNRSNSELQLIIIAPRWEIIDSPEIILDGPPGADVYPPKVPEEGGFGIKGQDGEPGAPGGPGGYFLGIGGEFINGQALRISVNGGIGGDGQDGGNGSRGRDGEMPSASRLSDAEEWRAEGYVVNRISQKKKYIRHFYMRIDELYEVYGTNGTAGGGGGNGGGGGPGGAKGTVKLIGLNSDSAITDNISCLDGADGRNGVGGAGGPGGTNGGSILVERKEIKNLLVTRKQVHVMKKKRFGREASHGYPGLSGQVNAADRKRNKFLNPSFAVNAYKSFFRYNLKRNANDSSLMNYINKLEDNDQINGLYDTIGLVDELRSLEDQYHRLNEQIPLLPFYKSLLKRSASYAKKPKDYEKGVKDSDQYKKVLCYLYTATMSKISSLSTGMVGNLVIDIKGYLDLVAASINRMKESTLEVAKDDFNNRHKQAISDKIRQVNDSIDTRIVPYISKLVNQLDEDMHRLIADVISAQKMAREGIHESKIQKEKLEKILIMRGIMEIVSFAASFLVFLGPIGQLTSRFIGDGVVLIDPLITGDRRRKPELYAISKTINDGLELMNAIFKRQSRMFLGQMRDIQQEIDLISKKEPSIDLNNIKEQMSALRERVKQEAAKGKDTDPAVIGNLRSNLQKTLSVGMRQLQKYSLDSIRPEVAKLVDYLAALALPLRIYNQVRNDENQVSAIGQAAERAENALKTLKAIEQDIYGLIIPMFRSLKALINTDKIGLKQWTGFDIELRKFQIQERIGQLKSTINLMVGKLRVGREINHFMNILNDAMTTMINMYQQIDHYRDEAELYAHISHIGSNDMMTIKMDNEELRRAVLELEQIVRSNIVLNHYKRATSAFMQFVFPLAPVYLPELALPEADSTEGLVFSAVTKIENLKDSITESAFSINKYDRFIHTGVKFARDQGRSPFHVWDHATNKDAISRLFRGEEVSLAADVTKSYNNAIKFNEVGIMARVSNGTSQDELDRVLQDFSVTMTHSGNSYYRCGSEIYTISSDSQAIEYSFQKNKRGEPVDMNLVYRKIRDNDFMLSPYTVWSIRLSSASGGFDRLKRFADDNIDLELEGRGQYVERGLFDNEVCKGNLKAYYRLTEESSRVGSTFEENSHSASSDHEDYVQSYVDEDVEEYPKDNPDKEVEFGSSVGIEDWKYVLDQEELPAVAQDNNIFAMIKMLNPGQWFRGTSVDPREQAPIASSGWTNLSKVIADGSPVKEERAGPSMMHTHGNILLLDLLTRKFAGPRHNGSRRCLDDGCDEFASKLAYNHYIQ